MDEPLFSVLVVDDEKIVRDEVANGTDWNALGFSLAGVAEDGADAIKAIPELLPDVVVTDIKMIDVGGIELLRWARENYPSIEFVVLSGYDEFDFARSALDLGAFAYVLKVDLYDELPGVIAKLRTRLLQLRRETAQRERLVRDTGARLFEQLLSGGALEGSGPLGDGRPTRFFALSRSKPFEEIGARRHSSGTPFTVLDSVIGRVGLVAVIAESSSDAFREFSNSVFDAISSTFDQSLSDHVVTYRSATALTIREAVRQFDLTLHGLNREMTDPGAADHGQVERWNLSTIKEHLLRQDLNYLQRLATRARDAFLTDDARSLASYQNDLLRVLTIAELLVAETAPDRVVQASERAGAIRRGIRRRLLVDDASAAFAEEVASQLFPLMAPVQLRMSGVIEDAIQYVTANYDTHIYIEDVARRFGLSPPSFSAQFKEATQRKFSAFVNDVRLGRARDLLGNTELLAREIASAVGYTDTKYFMKLFKSRYGMTPTQYRDSST